MTAASFPVDLGYQLAMTALAAHAGPAALDALAEDLLARGGDDAWACLAARTDIPEPVAVAAVKQLIPAAGDLAPRHRSVLIDAGRIHPGVQRWLARRVRKGLERFADLFTDADAVAVIVQRAVAKPASDASFTEGVLPAAAAGPSLTLAALAENAERTAALTAARFADRVLRAYQAAPPERTTYKSTLLEAFRGYGAHAPQEASAAVLGSADLGFVRRIASTPWLTAAARHHAFEMLVEAADASRNDGELQLSAQPLREMWKLLPAADQTRLVELSRSLTLAPTLPASAWLVSLAAATTPEERSETDRWAAMAAEEVAREVGLLSGRVPCEVATALARRRDVPARTVMQLVLTGALAAEEALMARGFDRPFQVQLVAARPALLRIADLDLVPDAVEGLVDAGSRDAKWGLGQFDTVMLADRLGPKGVWRLSWRSLTRLAAVQPQVAAWVADRLTPLLSDPDKGSVLHRVLACADDTPVPAETLLTAAAAAAAA